MQKIKSRDWVVPTFPVVLRPFDLAHYRDFLKLMAGEIANVTVEQEWRLMGEYLARSGIEEGETASRKRSPRPVSVDHAPKRIKIV